MRDIPDQTIKKGIDAPMTLLAVNQGYWLYDGEEFLKDMLYARGAYPFKVRCFVFESAIELNRFAGEVSVAALWRINPDIVGRLKAENLLIEIFSPGA
jgi:hypothetical protein